MRGHLPSAIVAGLAVACATTGVSGVGDRDLPTAGVGPFRKLGPSEVSGVAPFVLDDRTANYREPAVLAVDPSAGGLAVLLYAVMGERTGSGIRDVIVRTRADDGRTFFGALADTGHAPRVVLEPGLEWEGGGVTSPFAVRVGAEIFLYYAGRGGIGLARSPDGLVFTKAPEPVLVQDPEVLWETAAPRAPTVAALPDGRLRMLYASGVSIGEAESKDGVVWTRLDPIPETAAMDPVLSPSAPVDPASLAPGEKPPFDLGGVGDPCLVPRITPAGRFHMRVLYTGYDAAHTSAIGFAARYGDQGPLVRQPAPLYSVGKKEAAPALFEMAAGSVLYVQQERQADATTLYPAIAAAFAPANLTLPPPAPFPDGP